MPDTGQMMHMDRSDDALPCVVRPFEDQDAETVAALIARTFMEISSKDYPEPVIQALVRHYSPETIRAMAKAGHTYIAWSDGTIIGCGTISAVRSADRTCQLSGLFVLPEWQGRGIGRIIVQALESDPACIHASRIILRSSITARSFYEQLGYQHQGGLARLDEDRLYPMEKQINAEN